MPPKKTVHIVPHSHWDREWYLPFEKHRYRLVKLMDSIIEKMEKDPEYKYYHLDGQMIVLEDYLKIRPYMFERIKKLVNDRRIQVGPWYVLQDEYLISDEANVRNMLIGLSVSEEMGMEAVKIGYLPDSFGNISQMPQILSKCGIDTVVFGRGVLNMAEIVWEAPDGSRVVGGHFTSWYNNANELPTDDIAAKERAKIMLEKFYNASKIDHYLGMNGSDHQPLQENLSQALETFNRVTDDDVCFIHSNLPDYMDEVLRHTDKYPVISEEMAGQNTDGNTTLISTASARIYMKQKNLEAQNSLERMAEPLGVRAYLMTGEYQADQIKYAWKRLLENHAHDSICGCSVDSVHAEVMQRLENVIQVSEAVCEDAVDSVARSLDIDKSKGYPVVVFNNTVYNRSGIVNVSVDIPEDEGTHELMLVDSDGKVVSELVSVEPHTFTYVLPSDSFRKVIYVTRYNFALTAEDVPAFGYRVYYATVADARNKVMTHSENSAENDFIKLVIEQDGSLTVTDKASGKIFGGLNVYEDTADVGDEYIYRGNGSNPVTTKGIKAEIALKSASYDAVTFSVTQELMLPEKYDRKNNAYSDSKVPFVINTEIMLTRLSRGISVKTVMNNNSECHRLRALFNNSVKTDEVLVNGQFDVLKRSIATRPEWKCPTNEQRLQSFVALKSEEETLLVATRALYEYEVLRDGSNTLCLNLLRCTDQLGDWGEFPTPEAQCKGENIAEYEIFVGDGKIYDDAQTQALQFASGDMYACQVTVGEKCDKTLPMSMVGVIGDGVWSTALKKQDKGDNIVLRLYNTKDTENSIVLKLCDLITGVDETDMLEHPTGAKWQVTDNMVLVDFGPKEIKTFLLKLK